MNARLRLAASLLLSLLLHAGLFGLVALWRAVVIAAPKPIEISLVDMVPAQPPAPRVPAVAVPAQPEPEPPQDVAPQQPAPVLTLPERQIVSPPEAGEEKAPENTRLLSDRDNTVKEERVHRGEPAPADDSAQQHPPPPAAQAASKAVRNKPAPVAGPAGQSGGKPGERIKPRAPAPVADLKDLLPGVAEMARADPGLGSAAGGEPEKQAKADVPQRRDLLKHGDPWSGIGRGGVLDFLPDVREGDITLLNTKAEIFAPFVRRVGLRVFQNFVILLRRDLASARSAANEMVTMEAVMSPAGEMISLDVKERSTAASFGTDRNLQRACQEGLFDRNPPQGAEMADGNIHFLLNARVQIVGGPDGRAAGYGAMFSIGLL